MLSSDDKDDVRDIVREEFSQKTEEVMAVVSRIEGKLDMLKDMFELIKGQGETIDEHEERISTLESSKI